MYYDEIFILNELSNHDEKYFRNVRLRVEKGMWYRNKHIFIDILNKTFSLWMAIDRLTFSSSTIHKLASHHYIMFVVLSNEYKPLSCKGFS